MKNDPDPVFAENCADDLPDCRERLVTIYQKSLRRTVAAVLKRYSDASAAQWMVDDMVQEIFAALFEKNGAKLRTFHGKNGCSLGSWLRVIAVRRTLNELRRPPLFGRGFDGQIGQLPDTEAKTIDQNLINGQAISIIRSAVEAFPDMDRLIFRLIFEDEVGYEAAAAVCRMTKGSLYTRISRIRERLRKVVREAGLL